jgi:HEAT repeat protein
MPPRSSLDDKLAAVRRLRGESLTLENMRELRKLVGDRSNFVVAAAAAIVGERTLVELANDLEAAFARFMVEPLERDKLCRAKIAIVQALDKLEHSHLEIFETASKHVQFEPVFGRSEDSAPPLRAAALIAIARIEGATALPRLIDAMIDPASAVRIAAAAALGAIGTEAANYLLRLKARVGDDDSEVLSECLSGLLIDNPREQLEFVYEFLDASDVTQCEAAAVALGKSRLPEALEPLVSCWRRSHSTELRQQVLLSIAMLRLPAAIDFLVDLVMSDSEPAALAGLAALAIHNYDVKLRERLSKVIDEKGSPAIERKFLQSFSSSRLS